MGEQPRKRVRFLEPHEEMDKFFVLHERIGAGSYGVVYKASPKTDPSKIVAIKTISNKHKGFGIPLDAYREISILFEMSQTPHPNLVRLDCVYMKPRDRSGPGRMYLVYDYYAHDLSDVIRSHRRARTKMPPTVLKSIMWQCLRGVHFLHANWIIHRDVKPDNVLMTSQDDPREPGCVKIADFGLSRIQHAPFRKLGDDGEVCTIWYRAPELLLGTRDYTAAVDMWSVGAMFAELYVNTPVFQGLQRKARAPKKPGVRIFQDSQLEKIFAVTGAPTPESWPEFTSMPFYSMLTKKLILSRFTNDCLAQRVGLERDSTAFDLLSRMLCFDPSRRISAEDALRHPFFTERPLPQYNAFLNLQTPCSQRRPLRDADSLRQVDRVVEAQKAARRKSVAVGASKDAFLNLPTPYSQRRPLRDADSLRQVDRVVEVQNAARRKSVAAVGANKENNRSDNQAEGLAPGPAPGNGNDEVGAGTRKVPRARVLESKDDGVAVGVGGGAGVTYGVAVPHASTPDSVRQARHALDEEEKVFSSSDLARVHRSSISRMSRKLNKRKRTSMGKHGARTTRSGSSLLRKSIGSKRRKTLQPNKNSHSSSTSSTRTRQRLESDLQSHRTRARTRSQSRESDHVTRTREGDRSLHVHPRPHPKPKVTAGGSSRRRSARALSAMSDSHSRSSNICSSPKASI